MQSSQGRPGVSKKRARDADSPRLSAETGLKTTPPPSISPSQPAGGASSTTNFRQVSACNRCRHRKNRCDQALPQCGGCLRAHVPCVGFDPVSKRTIPRSYVYYLETRVRNLEALLRDNGLEVPVPEQDFPISEEIRPGVNVPFAIQQDGEGEAEGPEDGAPEPPKKVDPIDPVLRKGQEDDEKLDRLVSDVGMVSVHGASDSRFLGSTSGISFARVVFAAVKSSVPHASSSERKQSRQVSSDAAAGGATSMRESFFGLHTKPTIKPAPFPEKKVAKELVDLYFEHANPQIPVLHRGEFMSLLERAYSTESGQRTPRELYLLNIVFAIGSGIIMDSSRKESSSPESTMDVVGEATKKRKKTKGEQHQPEEYHSSAVVHLESFLGSSPAAEGTIGGLEELQAVLLLAGLALLRPVAPGLWYIVGVAMRLAVDLGLHSEDVNPHLDNDLAYGNMKERRSLGRKQWTRDLRRRLWWCVYAFDRLVSTCVGRPFGITDLVITTEFPSLLDDRYITINGFLRSPQEAELPSYKLVAHHYFRLRLLQSEILQVLQHRQAEQARLLGANQQNSFMHTHLRSPFLAKFESFRAWRIDVDRRLWEWKETAPRQFETGVAFTPLFLELNYWQAIIMLYRPSLAVPEPLAGELSPSTGDDLQSPGRVTQEAKEDEQMVFMKVAQAGQTVLKIYRQLHRLKLVNYTFLSTHHLFMSGISFLYAIWHSTLVRSQLTLDDVDFTVLIATSVLGDLIEKCPPAEACRDAFVRMSKATIAMVQKTTGFGNLSTLGSQPLNSPDGYFGTSRGAQNADSNMLASPSTAAKLPKFEMNPKDFFSEAELAQTRPPSRSGDFSRLHIPLDRSQHQQPIAQSTSPSNRPTNAHNGSPPSNLAGMQPTSFSPPQHANLHQPSIIRPSDLDFLHAFSSTHPNPSLQPWTASPPWPAHQPDLPFDNSGAFPNSSGAPTNGVRGTATGVGLNSPSGMEHFADGASYDGYAGNGGYGGPEGYFDGSAGAGSYWDTSGFDMMGGFFFGGEGV